MRLFRSSTRGMLAASALLLASPIFASGTFSQEVGDNPATSDEATKIAWVQADAGAIGRSFPDRAAAMVVELIPGQLMQVLETSAGTRPFYRVEVAGGFLAWVHGKYVTPSGNQGVLTITGDRLNMRPMPSSGPDSMALPDRLMLGKQVEMAGRNDESLPMSEDWIQIWAPAGSSFWVEASQASVRTDATAAAAEFAKAARPLPTVAAKPKVASKLKETPKPQQVLIPAKPGARQALTTADGLYEAAMAAANPDGATWTAVQNAYLKVVDMAGPSTPLTQVASRQAERCGLRAVLANLGGDITEREDARRQRIAQLLDEQRLREMARTPDWGRFDGRGWVESVQTAGDPDRWFIWWAGTRRVELISGDGRYDLTDYVGYQVGIAGAMRREYSPPTLEVDEQLPLLDVRRIEVIAGGRKRR